MGQETELIKERLDLAELVGEYVELKRAGNHFKGLCPFHQEKTPSFIVSPDKGIWHCFGCQNGGDAFSFVQRAEGVEFPEALKLLADRTGVELAARAAAGPSRDRRARLFELLDLAAKLYHEILVHHPPGTKARAYLTERGVNGQSIEEFQIGYAPTQWDFVQQYLRGKGFTEQEMIDSGLVGRSARGSLYDRFRGRIMFPIHDVQDRCVGFGGRIVPWHATGEEGKYINSPETPVYEKRRVVYNLNRAKRSLRQHQPAIVVEGYLDVVLLVQSGVQNVVATSGTAFTAEHVQQLSRYTDTLHFAFDADAAGMKAATAATEAALAAGLRVATILFPAGHDPADVAARDTVELKKVLSKPTPLVTVLLQRLAQADSVSRDDLLEHILPLVRQVTNVVQQGEMVQQLAATLHVPESVVVARLAQAAPRPTPSAAPTAADAISPVIRADQLALGFFILEPSLRHELAAALTPEHFLDETAQDLYKQIIRLSDAVATEGALSADDVLTSLPAEYLPLAEAVRHLAEEHEARGSSAAREVRQLVRALRIAHLERRLRALQEQLAGPVAPGSEALAQFQAVAAELAAAKAEQVT